MSPQRITGEATIDGDYRYRLWREVDPRCKGRVVFVMLNPSTADGSTDDPTIRRCMGFAGRGGFGELVVVNLYALRATNPREILTAEAPVGPLNDDAICAESAVGDLVVAAWGAPFHDRIAERARHVEQLLARTVDLHALGTTKHGHPRHPLYLPNSACAALYRMRSA